MRWTDLFRLVTGRLARAWTSTAVPVRLSRDQALVRAVAAVPHPGAGVRLWQRVEAVLAAGLWLCVLEDDRGVYVVEIDSVTGEVRIAATRAAKPAPATVAPAVTCRPGRPLVGASYVCARPQGSITRSPGLPGPCSRFVHHRGGQRR